MRQTTPITNECTPEKKAIHMECTPEKKAIHMELTHQMREKKRLLNEADYDCEKGTITLVERTKLYARIVLEYEDLRKRLIKNMS